LVVTPQLLDGFTTGPSEMTWHLSVVDAGTPRGTDPNAPLDAKALRRSALFTRWKNQAHRFQGAVWILRGSASDPDSPTDGRRYLFGLVDGIPITGDFDGDGKSELGVYHEGEWFIDLNGNRVWDEGDLWAQLGEPGDRPVVGDWNGDGKDDIGIYGPEWQGDARALAYEPGLPDFRNERQQQPKNLPPRPEEATNGVRWVQGPADEEARADLIDHVFRFGHETDSPVVGDWDGDGIQTIGIFREGRWTLDGDGDGALGQHDETFDFGAKGDQPVVGDFDGDGVDEIGVYRNGEWIIDSNHNHQLDPQDHRLQFGSASDSPVVGDFDGDGHDEPALYRAADTPTPRQAKKE
jgi:hypothetical protein